MASVDALEERKCRPVTDSAQAPRLFYVSVGQEPHTCWRRGGGKSADVIATAIVKPSAEIAHGYDATIIKTKDDVTIQGILIKEGDPLMMRSMGGLTQIIPEDRVASRQRMKESLMMSAAQLALTAQDVADMVAFLRGS